MAVPILYKNKCTNCRLCAEVCPANCFTFIENLISEDYRKCISCGRCVRTCPSKALTFEAS